MLNFIQSINEWIALIPTIVMGASLICSLTPTPVDDNWIKKIYVSTSIIYYFRFLNLIK